MKFQQNRVFSTDLSNFFSFKIFVFANEFKANIVIFFFLVMKKLTLVIPIKKCVE